MINFGLNPLEQVGLRFASALRQHMIGQGMTRKGAISAKALARCIHVSPKTVEGWLAGETPRNTHFWRVAAHFGPGFLNDVIEPLGWCCMALDERKGRV